MLLRVDYDSAATRRHLFADNPAFALKVVVTRRITWFEPKIYSPSEEPQLVRVVMAARREAGDRLRALGRPSRKAAGRR